MGHAGDGVQLRAALAGWPAVGGDVAGFLDGLPWRHRQVAVLYFGQGLPGRETACRLAISCSTVSRDARAVLEAWEAAQGGRDDGEASDESAHG